MQADWSVELGDGDAVLEFPWHDPEGRVAYVGLKRNPGRIASVVEVNSFPPLADLLLSLNAAASGLETAKCDAWLSTDLEAEEEIFGMPRKCGSYVDVLFEDPPRRASFSAHEALARESARLLAALPEIPASAEFIVRRCRYREPDSDGFYITAYVFGYGPDEGLARTQWAIALQLAGNALRQAALHLRPAVR